MPAVAGNDEIGTGGHRAGEHLIVVGIIENSGGYSHRLHQRGQVRVAIHDLFDG